MWCPGEDSNFHGIAPTRPSSVRVYQFHHLGIVIKQLFLSKKSGPLATLFQIQTLNIFP